LPRAEIIRTERSRDAFWGERLQTVREYKGLTQKELGILTGVSHALISDYEKQKRTPSPEVLERISSETKFPTEFFFRRIDDPFLEIECNFRHRRSTPAKLKDRVRAQATLLGTVVQELRKVIDFPEFDVPSISARDNREIEDAAESCRTHWGLNLNAPILHVGRALERAGVILVRCNVDTKKIDAFSRFGKNSLIFLNRGANTRPSRWNFDLAHECGHLVLHRGLPTGSSETESEADRFASAFLMPRTAFAREFRTKEMSWNHIFSLKRRWSVSAAAIIRRAHDLDLLSYESYQRSFQYMSYKRWLSIGEPYEPEFQEPELMDQALFMLGKDALPLNLGEFCRNVGIGQEVLEELTGIHFSSTKEGDTLQFQR
jgi:Zn-dependent peptidase ImmA (M78 family)/transcriptional regulator with XRE-family HTH domain